MNYLKMIGCSVAAALALSVVTGIGTASATELTCNGVLCIGGAPIHAESEGHITLDSSIGKIECESSLGGEVSEPGSASFTASVTITEIAFTGCTNGAAVKFLANVGGKFGTLQFHTLEEKKANDHATMTSTATEMTVELLGAHCIFRTNGTDVGPVTGGSTATWDIKATIPRVGGRSGALCGPSAPLTGSYKITQPDSLIIH